MIKTEPENSGRLILTVATGFFALLGVIFFISELDNVALFAGYGVGFLAVGLHYLLSTLSMRWENKTFFTLYSPLSLLRILTVLGIFIALIHLEKFDQFSFTVSFLISYIYHSVINIFLLTKRTNNRQG